MTSSVTYIFVFGIQTAYKFLIAIHPLDWETLTADTPLPHRPRAQGILPPCPWWKLAIMSMASTGQFYHLIEHI